MATDPSFGTIVDTRTVDQTTYTAFDRLYPDGTYYWRVQAMDAQDNGLTFSPVQSFTKASPAVVPSSPVGGALVSGTTPLRWNAQAFAASYTVEVYKNNDQTFSAANRIFTTTVRTTSVAPTDPIPASNAPYLWRVRRADSAGNLGPWSATASFISSGTAPSLLTPKASSKIRGMTAYFEWTEVPGAARYVLNLNGAADSKVTTVATAYAAPSPNATGAYSWSVTALDAAGNPLGTSAARTVKIDSTSPIVKKVKPAPIKPTSTISIKFSEKVKGVSKKSVVLVKVLPTGKFKKLKAKISIDKKKTTAKVNPKGRLRPGNAVPGAPQHEEDPRQGGQPARTEHRGARVPPAAPRARGRRSAGPRRPAGTTECPPPSAPLREGVAEPGRGSSLAP